MTPAKFTLIFTISQVVGSIALAVRLYRWGLHRTYRFFLAFLLFESIRSIAVYPLDRTRAAYANTYFLTQPILWLLYALATLEVIHVALRVRPSLATVASKLIAWCVGIAVVLAGLTMTIDTRRHDSPFWLLEDFLTIERVVTFSLLFFVLLLVAALSWFPFPLSRNALVHTAIFTFAFGVKAGVLFLRNVFGPSFRDVSNWILFGGATGSLVLWLVLLRRDGESTVVSGVRPHTKGEENELLAKLDGLTRALKASGESVLSKPQVNNQGISRE